MKKDIPPASGYLPFWDRLSENEKLIAENGTVLRRFEKGASVYSGGFDCMGLVYVLSGELRVYMMSEEGREITLYRLRDKTLCLLSASCVLKTITFEVHIQAEQATEIMITTSSAYEALMRSNIHVEAFSYKLLTERFSQVMFVMQQMLFKRFDQRLAAFLVDETGKAGTNILKLTHEQIAKYVGSAREVVTRMLKYFAGENLVSLTRGGIELLDKERLERIELGIGPG